MIGLNLGNQNFEEKLIMTDEAHFHLSGYVNKQNVKIWTGQNPCEIHERPLHIAKVTVWCAISRSWIIGPYFFENKHAVTVTVTGDRYRQMLREFFIPELQRRNPNFGYMFFQQDGATSHTSLETGNYCNRHFPIM
jgi:hypothetical protein